DQLAALLLDFEGPDQVLVQQFGPAAFGQASLVRAEHQVAGLVSPARGAAGGQAAALDRDLGDVLDAGGELGDVAGGGLVRVGVGDGGVAVEVDDGVAVAPAEDLADVQVAVDADQGGGGGGGQRRELRPEAAGGGFQPGAVGPAGQGQGLLECVLGTAGVVAPAGRFAGQGGEREVEVGRQGAQDGGEGGVAGLGVVHAPGPAVHGVGQVAGDEGQQPVPGEQRGVGRGGVRESGAGQFREHVERRVRNRDRRCEPFHDDALIHHHGVIRLIDV